MRWDKDNAESVMSLGCIYHSGLWNRYWKAQRSAAWPRQKNFSYTPGSCYKNSLQSCRGFGKYSSKIVGYAARFAASPVQVLGISVTAARLILDQLV